jgi:hypothetical protein
MSAAVFALFGAAIGGFFGLVSGLLLEIRRDCRRRIAASRLVVAEFSRSELEIFTLAMREEARLGELDPAGMDEAEEQGWLFGPHPKISGEAWLMHAAEFVGVLSEDDFAVVERSWSALETARTSGFFVANGGASLRAEIALGRSVLEPFISPSWFDRKIWRL